MNPLPEKIYKHLNSKYRKEIHKTLRFGRLPTHERLKTEILEFGESLGYEPCAEMRVRYTLNGKERGGRIDAVWLKDGNPFALFEVEEGLNTRAFGKLMETPAEFKFLVMFDVRRMMQRRVDKLDFSKKGITPIQLKEPH